MKPLSRNARARVDKVAPRRCLIENTADCTIFYNDEIDVAYVNCLPRETSSEMLDRLEYAWDMERRTLNLDTRSNIFRLGLKFCILSESYHWFLLPSDDTIEKYYTILPQEVTHIGRFAAGASNTHVIFS
ncbi:hypothetical protein M422DRAFT_23174 [Sphaerobolus stellatus SS14]|nr:hypothetical protein M422DRAFT_23174 [Sphaerobolus stellatus SS14]